ncbi:MAG: hypothetical protein R6U96_03380 [Promethearchaeia archaeon]
MRHYFDFDRSLQEIFNSKLTGMKFTWREWLNITSKEEFLETALKNSGLDTVENIFDLIKYGTTSSREFTLDPPQHLSQCGKMEIPIFTHTSGTTNPTIENLKWFHMSKELIGRLWAPGMQAIFESADLSNNSSAVIFVPSRLKKDGIQKLNQKKYISLYSLEFSQRIALATINPHSYLLAPYKESYNLRTIAKILELKKISTISTSFLTILGWANHEKMKQKIKNSQKEIDPSSVQNDMLVKLLKLIKYEGIDKATTKIQERLSEKIKDAYLISGISSLNVQKKIIHNFMHWQENRDKYINLYVASEIGPFAASIRAAEKLKEGADGQVSQTIMDVFPLTLPVIERHGKMELLTGTKHRVGKLLTSRMHNSKPLINIDTGDVIFIENTAAQPQIGGTILRAGFKLEYPLKLTDEVEIPENSNIYAGDCFTIVDLEILNPKHLLDCIINNCRIQTDSLLLVRTEKEKDSWDLVLPFEGRHDPSFKNTLLEVIESCPGGKGFIDAIDRNRITLKFTEEGPVDYLQTRGEILKKVRNGHIPKGILKKWPLYLAVSPNYGKKIC